MADTVAEPFSVISTQSRHWSEADCEQCDWKCYTSGDGTGDTVRHNVAIEAQAHCRKTGHVTVVITTRAIRVEPVAPKG